MKVVSDKAGGLVSGNGGNGVPLTHSPAHSLTLAIALAPQEPPWLLDVTEAARLVGVAQSTMEAWVADKTVGSFKKGRSRRIAREELVRFVLVNTLRPKRPEWLTTAVESDFQKVLREIVAIQVQKLLFEQRLAA